MDTNVRSAMRLWSFALICFAWAGVPSAKAYSVLTHEEVVDMAWKDQMVPLLRQRFPAITPDELRQAHAYAYGGSVIQDIGYYPFGSKYFSDLLHYVRPNEFVGALIRDSKTPDEYAFALGALAHFCGDTIGHPIINQVTAAENPPLKRKFGHTVTYAEDPTAHLRTEFGFEVVEVAQGHYSQQDYHDFIGFQVAKPLLEQAFRETYGLEMSDIIKREDLAISVYRNAVSNLIPKFTVIAFATYKDQIEKGAPGTERSKFVYRLNRTEYRQEFGTEQMHIGVGSKVAAFFLRVVPKVGPFKALKLTLPDAANQVLCLKSVNGSVDQLKVYLGQIHAEPIPVPPPSEQDVAAAKQDAQKIAKDAKQVDKAVEKAKNPEDKQRAAADAAKVNETATKAADAAQRTEQKAATAAPGEREAVLQVAAAAAPPTTPKLPELDLDTGKPVGKGEYPLADETYARLLDDLVKPMSSPAAGTTAGAVAANGDLPVRRVDPVLAKNIERFFSHPEAATGAPASKKAAEKQAEAQKTVQANLLKLRAMESGAGAGVASGR